MANIIQLERSATVTGGIATKPASMLLGELAVNYATGYESLFIKNAANSIITLNDWSQILNKPATLLYSTSLTANYLPYWNGSGLANSPFYVNGANVGIGTTGPLGKLEVNGTIVLSPYNSISTYASGETVLRKIFGSDVVSGVSGQYFSFIQSPDGDVSDGVQIRPYGGTCANALVTVLNGGNVGIGTTAPNYKLEVAGTILTGSTNNVGTIKFGTGEQAILSTASGVFRIQNWGGSPASYQDVFYATGGNVGIGTVSPTQKLDVNGNILMEGTNKFYVNDTGHYINYSSVADGTDGIGIYGYGGVQLGSLVGGEAPIMQVGGYFNSTYHSNIGIGYSTGTEIATYKLAVNGIGYFNNGVIATGLTLRNASNLSAAITIDASGNVCVAGNLYATGGISAYADTANTVVSALSISTDGNESMADDYVYITVVQEAMSSFSTTWSKATKANIVSISVSVLASGGNLYGDQYPDSAYYLNWEYTGSAINVTNNAGMLAVSDIIKIHIKYLK